MKCFEIFRGATRLNKQNKRVSLTLAAMFTPSDPHTRSLSDLGVLCGQQYNRAALQMIDESN
jgi:hypothetical protein